MKKNILFIILLFSCKVALLQNERSLKQINNLTGLENGCVSFVDYDNDNDMDMLIMGNDSTWTPRTELYQNTGTGLAYIQTPFDNLASGSADWGDFDNDGDEDLLITGYDNNYWSYASVFRNDGGGNFSFYLDFPGVSGGEGRWCDFNNDGFLDVILTGNYSTAIYQNYFYDFYYTVNVNMFSVDKSSLDVGDYDKDGDMDFIITGATGYDPNTFEPIVPELRLYRNDGNFNFTSVSVNIPAVSCGTVRFGDYDNDGDLDVLIAGKNSQRIATGTIYRNDNGSFTNISAGISGLIEGEAKWGDLDNDGRLDIILTGGTSVDANGYLLGANSQAYFNNGNDIFVNTSWSLYPSSYSSVAVADLDSDHALDFVIIGYDPNQFMPYTDLYLNSTTISNTAPTSPSGLASTVNGNSVTLRWNRSADSQTLSSGLTYNVRISSFPTGQEVVAANANISTGYRRIIGFGNVSQDTSYTFDYMPGGTVYWSVQAIDNNFEGSPFSANATFILPPLPPQLSQPFDSNLYVSARPSFQWNQSVGAASYHFQLSDAVSFTNIIVDSNNITNPYFQIGQDLIRNQEYYWRVSSTNTSGTSGWSEIWTFIPDIDVTTAPLANVCAGLNLQLNSTVQGGNMPINYLWTPGNFLNDSTIEDPIATLTNNQTFIVKAQDVKGWWKSDTVTVIVRPLPTVIAGPDVVLWPGGNSVITSIASGGTPPYTYSWSPSASLQGATTQNPLASPSVFTQYLVFATDSFGCMASTPDTLLADVMTITEINPGITGFSKANMALGDYDNDNDLDLLISGQTTGMGVNATKLYRNDNGAFTDVNAGFDQYFENPALWGDFDNEGDLDVFSHYWNNTDFTPYFSFYKNNSGAFTNQTLTLTSLMRGDAKTFDYDNDGDLDIIACGITYNGKDSVLLYVNNNGSFTEIFPHMIGIRDGKLAICDFDKDGDMDVAIAGTVNDGLNGIPLLQLYKNDNGIFTEVSIIKTEIMAPALSWADINYDGYDDLLVSGYYISGNYYYITKIYTNFHTYLQEGNSNTIQVAYGSFGPGDLDNDGDNDCVVSGKEQSPSYPYTYKPLTKLYKNQAAGIFMDPNIFLMGFENSTTVTGDYDNDGDLDIFITGKDSLGNPSLLLYKIDHVLYNKKPGSPTNLQSSVVENSVTLSWTKPADSETITEELKYNVYVGANPAGTDITSPMSDPLSGFIRNPAITNVFQNNFYKIELLPAGTYFWGVQAVDNGKKGSIFSTGTFTITSMPVPILISPYAFEDSITAFTSFTWTTVPSAIHYRIQISEDPTFQTVYVDTTTGTVTQYNNYQKLTLSTDYHWRVMAIGASASSGWSAIGHFHTWPQFLDMNAGLGGSSHNTIGCADYDNDGDLDIALNGVFSTVTGYETVLMKNENDTFSKVTNPFMGVQNANGLEWADYNNDGHTDLLISGADGNNWPYTALYQNNGNSTFTEIPAGLPYTKLGSASWGDYDNDGDPDILINGVSYYSGLPDNKYLNNIYRNNNGIFELVDSTLPAVVHGASRFFDYNNDGLLDIAVIGYYNDTNATSYPIFKIFRNNGGSFSDIRDTTLIGMLYASIDFGDYNNDGFTDMVTLGSHTGPSKIIIYKNNGGASFTQIIPDIYPLNLNNVHWGDYDCDGDLDLLVPCARYGRTSLVALRNDNGEFIMKNVDLLSTQWGDYSWIDYDNDHDLDVIVSGLTGTNQTKTRVYRNNSAVANQAPSFPANFNAVFQGSNLMLTWNAATDPETPSEGLTYNVAVGTSPGNPNICYPLSLLSTGFNKVVTAGNCGNGTSAIVKGLTPGAAYYISIQTIDNCFEGSYFAPFTPVDVPEIPANNNNVQIYPNPSFGPVWITLNSQTDEFCRIEVFDFTGKCVFNGYNKLRSHTPEKLDFPALSEGLYLVKIKGEHIVASVKVIIDSK